MSPASSAVAAVVDTYFKSYFWTFKLLVLFLAAFILAQTTNAFIGTSLAVPAADIAAPRVSSSSTRSGPRRDLTSAWAAFLDQNVFKAAREDLAPAPEVEPEQQDEAPLDPEDFNEANCQKSALSASLVTTMVVPNSPDSVAVFQDPSKKEITVYRVGDRVLDQAEVVSIERRNVFVRHNNRCERFSLNEEAGQPAVASVPRARPRGAKKGDDELGAGVAKVSENEYTIPKTEIDNVLSNLNKIATQARIVPSFRNGKANGFKLFSIRPNSLYAKIGIQNGDIIQKINGYEINSPDKALAIYQKLKDATNISVDLLRRGKKKSLSYNIR